MRSYRTFVSLLVFWLFFLPVFHPFHDVSEATLCVGGGGLSITQMPSSPNFGSFEFDSEATVSQIVFNPPIHFEDLRNTATGFTLSVTATDFTEQTDPNQTIDVTELKVETDDDDTVTPLDCDDATGITISQSSLVSFDDTDDDGTSDSVSLVSGDTTARIGNYSIDLVLELTIPSYQELGTYTSTLIFSLI